MGLPPGIGMGATGYNLRHGRGGFRAAGARGGRRGAALRKPHPRRVDRGVQRGRRPGPRARSLTGRAVGLSGRTRSTGGITDARGLSDSSAAPIARKGVRYLRRCRAAGDDSAAKPACGTPRAGRGADAGGALRCYSRNVASLIWRHQGAERGPAALAGRAEARGFGEERARSKPAVSAISAGDSFFRRQAHPHMRKATSTTNQHIPVAPGSWRGDQPNSE